MPRPLENLELRIVPRTTVEGYLFAEILYTFTEGGEPRCALTRLWHAVDDTAHQRAHQRTAFLQRRELRG